MATLIEIQEELARREAVAIERERERQEAASRLREERLAKIGMMRELEEKPVPTTLSGQIIVGDYSFANKREALELTRAIIASIKTSGMTDEGQEFLNALARNHPEIEHKTKGRPYRIEPTGGDCSIGLLIRWLDIPDWRTDPIGYRQHRDAYRTNPSQIGVDACLRTVPHHQRVKSAARMLASSAAPCLRYDDRYLMARERAPLANLLCAICDDAIPINALHWDHYPHGFADIFREWRIQKLLLWEDIALSRSNQLKFADVDLMRSWISFHERYATFRPTCQKCNVTDKERKPLILSEDEWQEYLDKYDTGYDDGEE